jgi:hypothetical protein
MLVVIGDQRGAAARKIAVKEILQDCLGRRVSSAFTAGLASSAKTPFYSNLGLI